MRILHVITSLQTGGAERLMVDLLPSFRDGGKNHVELLLFNGNDMTFAKELEQKGIKIHLLSYSENVYNPLNILKLVRYMGQFDIIHTHNTACQLYAPIAKMLSLTVKKLVTTEHSTNNRRRTKVWCKPIDLWMYNRYAAIVCVSQQAQDNLEAYIGKQDKIITINNGVDTSRFAQSIKDISGQNNFVITMVASFRPEKDHKTLLNAMKLLPDNYRLQLVGGGELQPQMENLCRNLGIDNRVDFMGVRSDVPKILGSSDIAVLSSHWEGFGLAAVEAMAAGCPVVATDVTGLRDVVNGAGVLFPVGDAEALANEIRNLCERPDYYRQVAQSCQERSKQYDISKTISQYLKLYRQLVPGK